MHPFVLCIWYVMFRHRLLNHVLKYPQTPSLNPWKSASIGLFKWLCCGFVMSVSREYIYRFTPRLWFGVKYAGGSRSAHGKRFGLRQLRCRSALGLFKKHKLWKLKAGRVVPHGFRHAEFNGARKYRFQALLGVANLISHF